MILENRVAQAEKKSSGWSSQASDESAKFETGTGLSDVKDNLSSELEDEPTMSDDDANDVTSKSSYSAYGRRLPKRWFRNFCINLSLFVIQLGLLILWVNYNSVEGRNLMRIASGEFADMNVNNQEMLNMLGKT